MQEYYTISWQGKINEEVEILRKTKKEAEAMLIQLWNYKQDDTLSIQKVILLTVEEYKEMVTRIKELEEECDNLVN